MLENLSGKKILSAIKNLNKNRILNIFERVALTFVGAFLVFYTPVALNAESLTDLLDKETLDKAGAASVAATVPLIAGLFGIRIGDKNTGSLVKVKHPKDNPDPAEVPYDNSAETQFIDYNVPMDNPAPVYSEEGK